MPLIILLTTTLFILISFTSNAAPGLNNIFAAYLFNQLSFIFNNLTIFILVYICLVFYFVHPKSFKNKEKIRNRIILCQPKVIQVLILGLLLSFVVLYVIAFTQLNILSYEINSKNALSGVVTNKNQILEDLQSNTDPLKVVMHDNEPDSVVVEIAKVTTGEDNFYGNYLLPVIPDSLLIQNFTPKSNLLLIDNTLIISKINSKDIQDISPIIAKQFVGQYFTNRQLKSTAKISILPEQNYVKYRDKEANLKIAELAVEINKLEGSISSVSAEIKIDQAQISNKRDGTKIALQYKNCVSAGYNIQGVFKRYYNDAYCINLYPVASPSASTSVSDWDQKLANDKSLLSNYQAYDTFFKSLKVVDQSRKGSIADELGAFTPPDLITINLFTTKSYKITDYFETLIHEYLHYASYVSEKKKLTDLFFEEGLTEYFARQIISSNLGIDTNLGYPAQVKIISEMTKLIPESELADIYFTKDEAKLEDTLDRVYGENFYKNNELLFESLQYSSNDQQILDTANKIMKKIGGKTLKEQDLYSTSTDLINTK